jgi:phosphoribosylamine-glycine ligase
MKADGRIGSRNIARSNAWLEARQGIAARASKKIHFDGAPFRRDIAAKAFQS